MTASAPAKVVSLSKLAASIDDGTSIAIGGSFLHRGPFALIRELVRQKKRKLEIIKPSPGYDVDLLCRAGAVAKVRGGDFANEDFYDLCARGGMDLAYLGCAQIDAEGRTNVSVIGSWHDPKVRLPGGGGAAVMLPTAKRIVTWRTEHSPRTLFEKLDFVTAAGNLAALITPIADFQRRNGRLALESWHPDSSLNEVLIRTGFKFDADGAKPTPLITQRERAALKELDPDCAFEAEAAIKVAAG